MSWQMSWSTRHFYGVGFDCEKSDPGRYRKFICNHSHSLRQAEWLPCDGITLEGFLKYFHEDTPMTFDEVRAMCNSNSIAEPVAVIMARESGIRFAFPGLTDDREDYVLFTEANPWEYNELEKDLTFEKLLDVMRPYALELGSVMEARTRFRYR